MSTPIRPSAPAARLALLAALWGCGGAQLAVPAPPPPPPAGVAFVAWAPRFGATLARLTDLCQRFGVPLDPRTLAREAVARFAPEASLEGSWGVVGLHADERPGLVILAPGAGPLAWTARPIAGWEVAQRQLDNRRLLITDRPVWADDAATWLEGLRPPTEGPDLVIEVPMAHGLAAGDAPPAGWTDPTAGAARRWLEARLWRTMTQIEALRLEVTLHRERVRLDLQARPMANTPLAEAVPSVPRLQRVALDRVPTGALGLLALELPTPAWIELDRMLRAASDEPPDPAEPDDRRRLLAALGGEATLTAVTPAEGPTLLAALRPAAPGALAAALEAAGARPRFSMGETLVSALTRPDGAVLLFGRSPARSWIAAGDGAEATLRRLLDAGTDAGVAADSDLSDVFDRTGAQACCLMLMDLAAGVRGLAEGPLREALSTMDAGPPMALSAGAGGGAYVLTLDLPLDQLRLAAALLRRSALRDQLQPRGPRPLPQGI